MNSFEKQSPATSKDSLHGILATISSKKWPRKAIDLKTPFLQGDEKLTRKVYLTPTSEAHIPHSHVWLLKKMCLQFNRYIVNLVQKGTKI